ncbi:MAG: modification methylase [Firmicutes bacterium]|nr:modification methylase [Bacillota bacterium]
MEVCDLRGNKNLHGSARNKHDEFYTQLSLIESELRHYKEHFKGKVIFCNCDDPFESNFFKSFAMNFNSLGLKKLIATCYASSPVVYTQLNLFKKEMALDEAVHERKPYKIEITEVTDENNDGRVDLADVEYLLTNRNNILTLLQGDGDFRSTECVELLKQADVVVTNPPFSLFREYMAQLVNYEKDFVIIGNQNAITYREIYPLIRDNRVWLGYNNGHFWFMVPDSYEEKKTDFKIDENGQKWRRMGNICWFTNLDIEKRHEDMPLFKKYSPDAYPKYDNYDAIEVGRTANIPCDYYGVMGVPITFMQYYNPEQFEFLGTSRYHDGQDFSDDINFINGKALYTRLLIRRRKKEGCAKNGNQIV